MAARTSLLLGAFTALLAAAPASATTPAPPRSFTQITPGGDFVFVMLTPAPIDPTWSRVTPEVVETDRALRRLYPRSGLYRNDGSNEPLWTVEWHDPEAVASADGIHLVRPTALVYLPAGTRTPVGVPLGPEALDVVALRFYANGRLTRTYTLGELVDDTPSLPRAGGSQVRWLAEGRLVRDGRQYTALTDDGNRITFDLASGEMVYQFRRGVFLWWAGWACLGVIVLAAGVWYARARRAARGDPGSG